MLIHKFEEQAVIHKSKLAVKGDDKSFTFHQLDQFANSIAHTLVALIRSTGPHDRIGGNRQPVVSLLFQHGGMMIAAMLAVLKIDGIYVPMDNSNPEARLLFMLEHSQSSILLTDSDNFPLARSLIRQSLPATRPVMLNLEILEPGTKTTLSSPKRNARPDDIAYILYTSGSTGRPKGVYQTRQNVQYYVENWIRRFSITAKDRMTLLTAFIHDGAGQDIFSALASGATLYPHPVKCASSEKITADFLNNEKITIWHSVPTRFRHFATSFDQVRSFPSLRYILLGGEPLVNRDLDNLGNLFPGCTMVNVYGQTESSVNSTAIVTIGNGDQLSSLGEPLDKTEIFLVDQNRYPLTGPGNGEIVIACPHMAPGYWQNQIETNHRFHMDKAGRRLFFTGDMGNQDKHRKITISGRIDDQVKIGGIRVEPGEIESLLLKQEDVKHVVVIPLDNDFNDKYLSAFIVPHQFDKKINNTDHNPMISKLIEHLKGKLPEVMIPAKFVFLEKLPLTPSGKVNRNILRLNN
jgi:amino acid adenylation domain-containing protein